MTGHPAQRLARWMVPAVAAHNFEEWLGRRELQALEQALAGRLGVTILHPAPKQFAAALVIATLAPALVLGLCSIGRLTRAKAATLAFVTALFVANAFLPHVALTLGAADYTPGVATALLINLPLGTALLVAIGRHGPLRPKTLAVLFACAAAVLPLAVAAAYALASLMA